MITSPDPDEHLDRLLELFQKDPREKDRQPLAHALDDVGRHPEADLCRNLRVRVRVVDGRVVGVEQ